MFPEFSEQIATLRSQDAHFASLFSRHDELDQEIKDMEAGVIPADGTMIENLKKQKLQLKDQVYVILCKASAS